MTFKKQIEEFGELRSYPLSCDKYQRLLFAIPAPALAGMLVCLLLSCASMDRKVPTVVTHEEKNSTMVRRGVKEEGPKIDTQLSAFIHSIRSFVNANNIQREDVMFLLRSEDQQDPFGTGSQKTAAKFISDQTGLNPAIVSHDSGIGCLDTEQASLKARMLSPFINDTKRDFIVHLNYYRSENSHGNQVRSGYGPVAEISMSCGWLLKSVPQENSYQVIKHIHKQKERIPRAEYELVRLDKKHAHDLPGLNVICDLEIIDGLVKRKWQTSSGTIVRVYCLNEEMEQIVWNYDKRTAIENTYSWPFGDYAEDVPIGCTRDITFRIQENDG